MDAATPLQDLRFAVLDTETTGLLPKTDRVVEAAVVWVAPGREPELAFESVINPERDVGPTRIHGLRAADVQAAPRFGEIASELVSSLDRLVWVGHNLSFDLRFLGAEFGRLGGRLPAVPTACTLQLSRRFIESARGHRLQWACEACGIPVDGAHSAAGDAWATAQLLTRLIDSARSRGLRTAGEFLRELPNPASWSIGARWPARREALIRARARAAADRDRLDFIPSLLARLPPPSEAEDLTAPGADLYLDLLDRVLADRIIDADERHTMTEAVEQWGLSRGTVLGVHHAYMRRLVRQAWADKVITPAEEKDLRAVAQLLAMPDDRLRDMIQAEKGSANAQAAAPTRRYVGKAVCFTGDFEGPDGRGMKRAEAEQLARAHGVDVKSGVSKKLDALVLADPNSQSGKATKARKYGVELVAEHVFWRDLGLA